ncbi:TPA: hypothetical protein JF904_000227 [Legionella pneumophila]|uniref:Uncharacterized protein n=1 Tax=Legionella pneumophila TaxID=446 RepID=A0AAP3MBG2_LEGPN|nr:hypothetical protein [Legionella pneumophila]MCW8403286.1 hypothetical protein [Legionella pneumophila]MCW8436006.1 hypothetical protein [Legionella pneumophila]MCW8468295.1 hypothetical protein [Legionella pneumophila]MCW8477966.1 hypothetical protein [Legionella pneumophila]MCZ4690127.1 hypothetical protein [Legionella pneumophila]
MRFSLNTPIIRYVLLLGLALALIAEFLSISPANQFQKELLGDEEDIQAF